MYSWIRCRARNLGCCKRTWRERSWERIAINVSYCTQVYLERTASKTLVSLCNKASRSSSYSAAFISSTTFLSGFALLLERFTATRVWANDHGIKICLPCGAIVCKNIYGTKISSLLQVLNVGKENIRIKCVPSLPFFLSFYPILDLVLVHLWDKL